MDNFWNKIKENEGNSFKTVTGLEFTYQVFGNYIVTNRTSRHLTKSNFEKAILIHPQKPGEISDLIQGSSYVFPILEKLDLI